MGITITLQHLLQSTKHALSSSIRVQAYNYKIIPHITVITKYYFPFIIVDLIFFLSILLVYLNPTKNFSDERQRDFVGNFC